MNRFEKLRATISLFSLSLIAVTIPIGVTILKRGYQFPHAAEAVSPVYFAPASGDHRVGEPFLVRVNLNTQGRQVDGLDLLINGVNLEVTGQRVTLPTKLHYQFGPENILNQVLTSALADPATGFTNTSGEAILELSVKGLAYCTESRLTINREFSVVASQGQNIIDQPGDAVFSISSPPGVVNPVFTSPREVETQVNEPFVYLATATNPNGANLAFSYSNLPDWLVAIGPKISGRPTRTGVNSVGIIVTDERGGSACATLKITVVDRSEIIISNVQASPVTYDSATIKWQTNRPATSVVEYGLTVAYGQTAQQGTLDQNHQVVLRNLTAATTYHFKVKSTAPNAPNEAVSGDYVFTTQTTPVSGRILKLNLKMEGKRPNDNDYEVLVSQRGGRWSKRFTPHGDGYFPLDLTGYPADAKVDLLLKGYQHLQVRRIIEFPPGVSEQSVDFGLLPAGDIGPRGRPDNYINTIDYSLLISEMSGVAPSTESIADLNSDGAVNSIDYSIMVNNFNRDGDS